MLRTTSTVLGKLLTILALIQVAVAANAAERAVLGNHIENPLAYTANPVTQKTLIALRQQANELGKTRIIIGLRVPFAPEGAMTAASAMQQRDDIAALQSTVLAKMAWFEGKNGRNKRFESIPFMALEVDASQLEALLNLTEVTYIEEDRLDSTSLAESVPLIGGNTAWSSGYTGLNQTVAILDSGVDKNHVLLAGKVVSEACYSTTGSGAVSVCPGGVTSSTAVGAALPYAGVCPAGRCDHGTHVAGIAAGNGASFSGVAKDAAVIAIQVFSRFDSTTDCTTAPCALTFVSDQILGLERVLALNSTYAIAAVNMSLGGGRFFDQASCDAANLARKAAIDNLRSVGIATIVASGNSGYSDSMGAPACISTALSVGATWDVTGSSTVNAVTSYSNSVSFLNLLAPGSLINSSIPGGSYSNLEGTSMAAPHVAGAWALLKHKKATLTVAEGLVVLSSTGLAVTDTRNAVVKPRIELVAALASIGPAGTNRLFVSKAGTGGGTVTSAPGGISCGATCSASYASGTSVILTAAAVGSTFTGWSGGCAGTGACTVTMSSVQTVTATFEQPPDAEVFPPKCQMPAGWTIPGTAQSGWSAVTDNASVGICSLKSNVIGLSQKAQIQFVGAFTAGNITFDRKVSSESGFDCFRFLIDGVQQAVGGTCGALGASGEVPWGPVSVPVSAGTHTLIWSYEKDSSVMAGKDAAWIDSVVLPLAAKKSIPAIFMFLMD